MRLAAFIRRKYSLAGTFAKVVKREAVTFAPMSVSARLSMWIRGFFSAAWYRYEFYTKKNRTKDYVTDYEENLKASRVNSEKDIIYVDNKVIFPLFFGQFAPVVYNYAIINNHRVLPQNASDNTNSFEAIVDLLQQGQSLVIKPADGQRGGQVHKFRLDNEKNLVWNDEITTREILLKELPKLNYNIVCPLIEQASYAKRIYPDTTNTIRILTLIDPDTKEAYIAHAVQRIGTKHSFPVDNFAVGGLTCEIDLDTGIIRRGSYIIPTESMKVWYTHHPETDEVIEGVQIPNWHHVKSKIIAIASSVSFLKVIGWDLIILDDSQYGFVLLEGNNAPCYKVHQLHGGLLKDSRIARFMKHHRIVR